LDIDNRQKEIEYALIIRICHADQNALEILYHDFYQRLFRFIGRYTWREDLIDEIINDVMFTVWEKAATFNHQCLLSTWIFGIAYNKARQALRNINQYNNDDSLDDTDIDVSFGIHDPGLKQLEMDDLLESAFSVLSPDQRAVLELTYFEGLSYSEIAELMECPENTVKTRMYYARKALALQLSEYKDFD
jgi:RNA polymerase sigma-70 factor (ECF subfamily)